LAVLLVLALLAGGAAYVQQLAAQDGQLLATSRPLVTQAATIAGHDAPTAIRLSEAAPVIHPHPDTRSVLVNRLLSSHFAGKLPDHEGAAEIVVSPTRRTPA